MQQLINSLYTQSSVIQLSLNDSREFEAAYTRARRKEQRLLNDKQVSLLPAADVNNPHYKEWLIRERSAQQVIFYLNKCNLQKTDWILDIGCGNGWFSNLLAESEKARVLAIDINMIELKQATRVFNRENLYFAYLQLLDDLLEMGTYSQIIFNSSFQYFEQPKRIIELCLSLLKENGEIHIIDSPLYALDEIQSAKSRSSQYYKNINNLAMNQFYHHHSYNLFDDYNTEILYQPGEKNINRTQNNSPFPWLKISQ